MAELVIIDGIHMETGRLCFAVVENDDWKFPQLGLFSTREKAQAFIDEQLRSKP